MCKNLRSEGKETKLQNAYEVRKPNYDTNNTYKHDTARLSLLHWHWHWHRRGQSPGNKDTTRDLDLVQVLPLSLVLSPSLSLCMLKMDTFFFDQQSIKERAE